MVRRDIDVGLLRAFAAVAETGGVTSAARALNLTQAAVSQQIKRLEEFFALGLFDREQRRLALTPTGRTAAGLCPAHSGAERRSLGRDDIARL